MTIFKNKKRAVWVISVLAVIVLMISLVAVYLGDYYAADTAAIEAFTAGSAVPMQVCENGDLLWAPENASSGFIFYPGGKVEHTAYIPLMEQLASDGILCVLVKMPGNLAVLDMNAAEGIPEAHPQIENWYIGGHSLGGSMAASFLSENGEAFDGLVLLGSYSTADLSETGLCVLSVYGSEDLVMNREKYESNKQNLPEGFSEIVIEGGCHAYFGMYGMQDQDGMPTITNEEQILFTADAILSLFAQKD